LQLITFGNPSRSPGALGGGRLVVSFSYVAIPHEEVVDVWAA
jgi:hypothetical protein